MRIRRLIRSEARGLSQGLDSCGGAEAGLINDASPPAGAGAQADLIGAPPPTFLLPLPPPNTNHPPHHTDENKKDTRNKNIYTHCYTPNTNDVNMEDTQNVIVNTHLHSQQPQH